MAEETVSATPALGECLQRLNASADVDLLLIAAHGMLESLMAQFSGEVDRCDRIDDDDVEAVLYAIDDLLNDAIDSIGPAACNDDQFQRADIELQQARAALRALRSTRTLEADSMWSALWGAQWKLQRGIEILEAPALAH